jgi:cell division protein FtsN
MDRVSARRRVRRHDLRTKFSQFPTVERKPPWALLAFGAFLLALVAFVCGVWMGKGLHEFYRGKGAASRTQAEKPPEFPSSPGAGISEPLLNKPTQEARENPENLTKKNSLGSQEKQILGEEKNSNQVGKTKTSIAESVKAGSPEKAKFTLQVAAFNNPEEARELVKQLQNKGYPAYQIPENAAAQEMWHRVRVGSFQSLQEARQFALTLEKKEKIKTIIASLQSP